jgi:hypothetical protein
MIFLVPGLETIFIRRNNPRSFLDAAMTFCPSSISTVGSISGVHIFYLDVKMQHLSLCSDVKSKDCNWIWFYPGPDFFDLCGECDI